MRVTPQHWEVFIEICEKHPNLITGKFNGAQGKAEGHTLWNSVTTKLNGLGLGEKSESEWRRAVTDWKSKVKGKAAKLTQAASETGGGPSTATPLTPLEERLIAIMGKKGFQGDEGIMELGLPSASISQTNQSNSNKAQMQEKTYQSILQEIEVISEPQPSTSTTPSSKYTVEEVLKNKRKHDENENHEPSQEHNYYWEGGNVEKPKRQKKKNIPRVSKSIEDMTSDSLKILKNIDQNTSKIANAMERIADVLVKKFKE